MTLHFYQHNGYFRLYRLYRKAMAIPQNNRPYTSQHPCTQPRAEALPAPIHDRMNAKLPTTRSYHTLLHSATCTKSLPPTHLAKLQQVNT